MYNLYLYKVLMHDSVSGTAEKEVILNKRPCACGCTNTCSLGCFPSTSTVNLENGKTVTMSDLQVGDEVQIGIK